MIDENKLISYLSDWMLQESYARQMKDPADVIAECIKAVEEQPKMSYRPRRGFMFGIEILGENVEAEVEIKNKITGKTRVYMAREIIETPFFIKLADTGLCVFKTFLKIFYELSGGEEK